MNRKWVEPPAVATSDGPERPPSPCPSTGSEASPSGGNSSLKVYRRNLFHFQSNICSPMTDLTTLPLFPGKLLLLLFKAPSTTRSFRGRKNKTTTRKHINIHPDKGEGHKNHLRTSRVQWSEQHQEHASVADGASP